MLKAHCKTIEQCLILDADGCKGVGGKPHADRGSGGRKTGTFLWTSFMYDPLMRL